MALGYPLDTPDTIGIGDIELRTVNSVAVSQSPFTYRQQVISHGGQKWEATVSLPAVRKDLAAPWKSLLVGLKGQTGTFLLGDPDGKAPQGTATTCSISGNAGVDSVSAVINGSLLAGDYIQIGTSGSSRLHMVLQDITSSGSMEIWPALRSDYTSQSATLINPKGVFRLATKVTAWSINNVSSYGISFDCVEDLS